MGFKKLALSVLGFLIISSAQSAELFVALEPHIHLVISSEPCVKLPPGVPAGSVQADNFRLAYAKNLKTDEKITGCFTHRGDTIEAELTEDLDSTKMTPEEFKARSKLFWHYSINANNFLESKYKVEADQSKIKLDVNQPLDLTYYRYHEQVIIAKSNLDCPFKKLSDKYPKAIVANRIDGEKIFGCYREQNKDIIIQWTIGDGSVFQQSQFSIDAVSKKDLQDFGIGDWKEDNKLEKLLSKPAVVPTM
jgi:hypothetical protein